ncbi:hypothetical protein NC651_036022 [Populus alba x Populus x berolinensis]|nr:hypothetical protein NC651_036022 [Populus alba x Populus x berolinensis]
MWFATSIAAFCFLGTIPVLLFCALKRWLTSHFKEATGVLSSNDACRLSHYHPDMMARFSLAWSGRDSNRDRLLLSGNIFLC